MISELVDPAILATVMSRLQAQLTVELGRLESNDKDATATADEAGASKDDVRKARDRVKEWEAEEARELSTGDTPIAIPRSPIASLVQSAYEEFFLQTQSVRPSPETQGLAPASIPASELRLTKDARELLLDPHDYLGGRWAKKYAERDARFILYGAAAKIATFLKGGRRTFTPGLPPPITVPDRVRVLLVGDWGSGIPRAQQVSALMKQSVDEARAEGLACHVIHLGDVYYTGQPDEYDRRFLLHWPVAPRLAQDVGSWCLNGNHDMYSGGYSYFDRLLKDGRFALQERRSFFSLENAHWQILGLDSAYDEADLHGPQAGWVAAMRERGRNKKSVLLSHHQLFSAWGQGSPKMAERLAPVLNTNGGVTAWFWGHEHRCAAYSPTPTVKYARVAGHGGVPVWAPNTPTPGTVIYELRDSFTAFIDEHYARFGYVQLDFDGPQIHATYINELKTIGFRETIE